VAVVEAERVLAERSLVVTSSHATALLRLLGEVLDESALDLADVELVAVSIGPGSFTGLRIALSAAKGLCLATGIPIVGVPTLEILARALGPRRGLVCPVLDARKGEVYGAAFQWDGEDLRAVRSACAVSPAVFAHLLESPCTLLGDGVDAYEKVWKEHLGEGASLIPAASLPASGAATARLGGILFRTRGADDPETLEPDYLRRSEAEIKRGSRSSGGERAKN
jgi:tRNA threonylcarbamoyladenosine biosynthesis protein TsaB